VVVTPSALTFTPGDGGRTVSCPGPGSAWAPGRDSRWSASPSGCEYAYPRSSYAAAKGEVTATYAITWRARWTGSGRTGGTFPDISTTTRSTFAVAEAEAVVIR
jgi:hypothetical protein